jgi:signal transduction histidine kinase
MNQNGIGLGLVISKEICNLFGGEISFNSKLKEGSTFMFTF